MCFKNLPIEFDASGKAQLKAGVSDPYSVTVAEPKGFVRRKEGPEPSWRPRPACGTGTSTP